MNKYYINITNKCDYSCPFCCMYSSPKNDGFMSFNTLYDIIEKINTPTVVQLEGGEPLLHPNIILFLEYLASKEFVSEIVSFLLQVSIRIIRLGNMSREIMRTFRELHMRMYGLSEWQNLDRSYDFKAAYMRQCVFMMAGPSIFTIMCIIMDMYLNQQRNATVITKETKGLKHDNH